MLAKASARLIDLSETKRRFSVLALMVLCEKIKVAVMSNENDFLTLLIIRTPFMMIKHKKEEFKVNVFPLFELN